MDQLYRICSRCVMDTSDPEITFDANGVCSHCHRYETLITDPLYLAKRTSGALQALVSKIQRDGRGKPYDCILGVSGGVDSTYVAYTAKKLGLRPLAVHLDNGWNSELAVSNIEKTLNALNIDLYTHVLDWDEFRDLQLAFLKASTPDAEVPTDHAIVAVLYAAASKHGIRYILGGTNTSTEGGSVAAWTQGHSDWRYIKSVHKQFGQRPLKSFPHYGPARFAYYALLKKIQWISFLDFIDYDKHRAIETLEHELGWRPYGGKHYESVYTRFYQGALLPKKFGFDKRRLHVASLIWSSQLTREQALKELLVSDYPAELQQEDRHYVMKKLGLSHRDFEVILEQPPKTFWDYPSYKKLLKRLPSIRNAFHALKRT